MVPTFPPVPLGVHVVIQQPVGEIGVEAQLVGRIAGEGQAIGAAKSVQQRIGAVVVIDAFRRRVGNGKRQLVQAVEAAVQAAHVMRLGAQQATLLGHHRFGQPGQFGQMRVEARSGVARQRRPGNRGEVRADGILIHRINRLGGQLVLPLQCRRGQGRQREGVGHRVVAEEILFLQQRRHHHDAVQDHPLIMLQCARYLHGANAAIALAHHEFRAGGAAVPR